MLRVTKTSENASRVTLKLEGQIVSDWAGEMERECRGWLQSKRLVLLDLEQVTFTDSRGVAMLRRAAADGVELRNCPPLIEALLRDETLP